MTVFLFIALAVILILGNAMILLRTAKKPNIPDSVENRSSSDDEDAGW